MKLVILLTILGLSMEPGASAQRLPRTTVPESYDLSFEPDLEKATFTGNEVIHVVQRVPSNTITLNSAQIEFQEATVTSGDLAQRAEIATSERNETATLTLAKPVPDGPAEIHIRFTGVPSNNLNGFYLSKTPRRKYAVTQFEPTDARRAFPSFDEPSYKAVFRIRLVIGDGDAAISNGRIVSDTPGPEKNKHTIEFAPTPRISTYLVAMIVGDFSCREENVDGIPIRVCTVPEQYALTDYALRCARDNLSFYDKYFSQKYPYGKLDIIAVPDFEAGGWKMWQRSLSTSHC